MHQFDLLYMPSDTLYGNKYKYILAGIDATSRYKVTRSLRMKQVRDMAEMIANRKNDLFLIMTPEKQDKTLELSKHCSVDSTPARNEVIMKRTYPVKSVKCDKICSNY